MLKFLAVSFLLFPAAAQAADLGSLKVYDIAASRQDIPAPKASKVNGARYADGILPVNHLMALTGPKLLYTQLADTEAKFSEFKARWEPVIKKAGLKPLPAEYSPGFAALKYESADGSAIRSFLCDTAHLPLSEAAMEKTLVSALKTAGLKVIGSFGLPVDPDTFIKPTVNIYYLTAYNENPDREVRLRYLRAGDAAVRLDHAILEKAGVKIAASYNGSSAFYIGRRVGLALAVANSEQTVEKQIAYHKQMISARGEQFLGVKTDKLEQPVTSEGENYSYLTKIYYLK